MATLVWLAVYEMKKYCKFIIDIKVRFRLKHLLLYINY